MRIRTERTYEFDVACEELWAAMARPEQYRQWWPWLRSFDGRHLAAGDVWHAVVQPPLPYRVRFAVTLTDVVPCERVVATVSGSIEGDARLEIVERSDGGCDARLVASLAPAHPALRALAVVARPVVRYGHDWVLDRGAAQFRERAGLIGELPGHT